MRNCSEKEDRRIEANRRPLWLLIHILLAAGACGTERATAGEPLAPASRNTSLVISEIMFRPTNRVDGVNLEFIELYNSGAWAEDLSGYRLSGEVSYIFPSNSWLAARSFLVVAANRAQLSAAYQITNVTGPWTVGVLGDESGTVRLRNRAGALLLEASYSSDVPGLKLADGRGHSIVLARPSLGETDPRAWVSSADPGGSPGRPEPAAVNPLRAIVINEILANSAPPDLDFIEVYNRGDQEIDISGCSLSDNPTMNKFIFQATVIGPRSYLALDEVSLGFDLRNAGDTVYLRDPTGAILDLVSYGALPDGVSFGRVPAGGSDFATHFPSTPFAPNTTYYSGDIVINEILYAPISDHSDDEFVELYNRSAHPVDVSGWRFTSGIDFTNPPNTVMAPGGYLVVGRNAAQLRSHYPQLNSINLVGDYSGSLSDEGERITLARPELMVDGLVTNVIYVPVNEVTYGTGGQWGQWSHGGGSSLELIDSRSDNRFPANWGDSDESGKAPWTSINFSGVVDFGVGPANALHALLLGEGECLLDSIEVQPAFGMNLLNNGSFEAGTGWSFLGNHIRSAIESGGIGGGQALHMRSSGAGEPGVNRVTGNLTSTILTGTAVTIRAQARWLRGHPGILLRLYGNGLETSAVPAVPQNPGTPGLRNSRAATNAGPAIFGVSHSPILPEALQQIVVTAQVHDPDGLSLLRLRYRIDPDPGIIAVPMRDDGTGGDAGANDGVFSATIPGQPSGTLIAFHIEAVDGAMVRATNRFPASAPALECLVHVGETAPEGTLGDYRVWMTANNLAAWNARSELSDEPLDCTVVWNGARVIYNAGIHYDGDPSRRAAYQSPTSGPSGLTITLPSDDSLFGSRLLSLDGVNLTTDPTGLRELTAFWMASRLGLPVIPPRLVRVRLNGSLASSLHLDRHLPDESFLANWFDGAAAGQLFEAGKWIETGAGPDPLVASTRDPTLENFTTTGGVKKQARYRWNWRKRFNSRLDDNYKSLFGLVDALNAPDSTYANYAGAALDPEWMAALGFRRAVGDTSGYGQGGVNDAAYVSAEKKWRLLPERFLNALGAAGGQLSSQELFVSADPTLNRLVAQPQFRRQYLQAMLAATADPLHVASYAPQLSEAHRALLTNGIAVTSETDIVTWVDSRRNFLLSQIPTVPYQAPVWVLTGNLVTLMGTAPVAISYLTFEKVAPGAFTQFNGATYPLTWSGVTTWSLELPLEKPTQSISVAAYDADGSLLTAWSLPVNFPGSQSPVGAVVINEIMHHPVRPGAAFVELRNISTNAFDLASWRLVEPGVTFSTGTVLRAGAYMVCTENRGTFVETYGAGIPIAAEFTEALSLPAGTLTLRKPDGTIVDKVQYDTRAPWPTGANQPGVSLQLIDGQQDDSRVANWTTNSGPPAWHYFSYTSVMPANSTNFVLFLSGPGDLYVDDAWLVPGTVAATGSNYLQNGDFESDLEPWTPQGTYTNSELSTNFSHSGTASLHLVAGGAGSTSNLVGQIIPGNTTTQLFTFSCWYMGGSVSNQLTGRTIPGSTFIARIPAPAQGASAIISNSTPGMPNVGVLSIPILPSLWLNEIQTENRTGPTDNYGDHEPWIELYNSGATSVDLGGYALSDNYVQYSQWPFPSGVIIESGEYLIIWADGETNESTLFDLHTSFRLNTNGGSLALSKISDGRVLVLDYLDYPPTPADRSYGSSPNGQGLDRTRLNPPTPGASNVPPVNLFINEWMASNFLFRDPSDQDFDDWFEIYNAGFDPFDLSGCYLTDTTNNPTQFRVPAGYVIPPRGYLLVWADNETYQNSSSNPQLHVNFKLSSSGESLGFFAPDGFTRIDAISFTNQLGNFSQGRFPDGAGAIYSMRFSTPGGPNSLTAPNQQPTIAPIADFTIRQGQTVQFTAIGLDPDLPGQSLAFNIVSGPDGAAITTDGNFTWTPSPAQPPGTYTVTVRVTDNGQPPLSGTLTFQVIVRMPPLAEINAFNNGHLAIRFDAITGRTYRVDWKEHLEDPTWTPLATPAVAGGTSVTVTDQAQPGSQRFYRVVQLD